MNKQQQPISFSKLIEKLRNEYAQLKERVDSLHSFLCDIDFEKRVPDPVEQRMMREQLHMMLGYMDNLRARISYQEQQQLRQEIEQLIPHAPIASVEKRGGDIIIHHCGQDCDCDDACCQAGSPCVRSAVAYDPNESQPVDTKPAITGESLYKLLGRQVICFLKPGESRCENCQFNPDNPEDCVKVELVGGYYLCLAPNPNTVTE